MIKVCCGTGKLVSEMSDIDKLSCNFDHCVGPIEIEEFDLLLTGLGTFNTEDCISAEELGKLIFKEGE
jgi:hypothetical protein